MRHGVQHKGGLKPNSFNLFTTQMKSQNEYNIRENLIFGRAKLYCCSCLSLMYFSVDLFHDNDVKFVELRTYLTSCVC